MKQAVRGLGLLIVTSCGGVAAFDRSGGAAGHGGVSSAGQAAAAGSEATAGAGAASSTDAAGSGVSAGSSGTAGSGTAGQAGAQFGSGGVASVGGQGGYGGAAPDHCAGPLHFADPDVEDALRKQVGKPTEPMYASDFAEMTDLGVLFTIFSGPDDRPCFQTLDCPAPNPPIDDDWVTSLAGVECLPQVQKITVDAWYVADFSPLVALTDLTTLGLGLAPKVSRLPPLPQLRELSLFYSKGDLQGVESLPNLTALSGHFEGLSGKDALEPLRSLKRLRSLTLQRSGITNVAALEALPELVNIDLSENSISDLSPLVRNPGLGAGTTIQLSDNPINCHDDAATALLARGVTLHPCN